MGKKQTLWGFWFLNTAVNVVFVLLGLSVHKDLWDAYENYSNQHAQSLLNGLIVSAVFAFILVVIYSIIVLVVLLRKTIAKSGAGFSYGMIVTMSFWTSFHLANITAHFWSFIPWLGSFDEVVELSNIRATVALGAVSTVTMLILGGLMVWWREVVTGGGPEDPPEPRARNNPLATRENREADDDMDRL